MQNVNQLSYSVIWGKFLPFYVEAFSELSVISSSENDRGKKRRKEKETASTENITKEYYPLN